jgi:LemA protein
MNASRFFAMMFGILVLGAVVLGGCAYSGYNRAVRYDEAVKNGWGDVENQLQRRYDLIPNVVETVKGYAAHEKELFENIAEARTRYFSAGNRDAKVQAANQLESVLSRLLVLKETYPELKANQGFLALQDQLEGSENRLAVARKRYNDAVGTLNTYARGLLGRLFCSWAGVEPAEYFKSDEAAKKAPDVKFTRATIGSQGARRAA